MTEISYGQKEPMENDAMVRTLDAQARAIWPQEAPLFRRYALPAAARILDAGCGTGEAASRLAELFPRAQVLGVDIIEPKTPPLVMVKVPPVISSMVPSQPPSSRPFMATCSMS